MEVNGIFSGLETGGIWKMIRFDHHVQRVGFSSRATDSLPGICHRRYRILFIRIVVRACVSIQCIYEQW